MFKPILEIERAGEPAPSHTVHLQLPLECGIDHIHTGSVGKASYMAMANGNGVGRHPMGTLGVGCKGGICEK